MLCARPSTVAECDEQLARITQARRECGRDDVVLRLSYDDQIDELLTIRTALIPEPRQP